MNRAQTTDNKIRQIKFHANEESSPSFQNIKEFAVNEEDPDFDKDICDGDLEEKIDSNPGDGFNNINQRTARMAHFGPSQQL